MPDDVRVIEPEVDSRGVPIRPTLESEQLNVQAETLLHLSSIETTLEDIRDILMSLVEG